VLLPLLWRAFTRKLFSAAARERFLSIAAACALHSLYRLYAGGRTDAGGSLDWLCNARALPPVWDFRTSSKFAVWTCEQTVTAHSVLTMAGVVPSRFLFMPPYAQRCCAYVCALLVCARFAGRFCVRARRELLRGYASRHVRCYAIAPCYHHYFSRRMRRAACRTFPRAQYLLLVCAIQNRLRGTYGRFCLIVLPSCPKDIHYFIACLVLPDARPRALFCSPAFPLPFPYLLPWFSSLLSCSFKCNITFACMYRRCSRFIASLPFSGLVLVRRRKPTAATCFAVCTSRSVARCNGGACVTRCKRLDVCMRSNTGGMCWRRSNGTVLPAAATACTCCTPHRASPAPHPP